MSDHILDQLRINNMRFLAKSEEYPSSVLPRDIQALVPLEAASTQLLERCIGMNEMPIGMLEYGALASIDVHYERFSLTPQHMVDEAIILIRERQT